MINPNPTVDSLGLEEKVLAMFQSNILSVTSNESSGICTEPRESGDDSFILTVNCGDYTDQFCVRKRDIGSARVVGTSLFIQDTGGKELQIGFIPDALINLEKLKRTSDQVEEVL